MTTQGIYGTNAPEFSEILGSKRINLNGKERVIFNEKKVLLMYGKREIKELVPWRTPLTTTTSPVLPISVANSNIMPETYGNLSSDSLKDWLLPEEWCPFLDLELRILTRLHIHMQYSQDIAMYVQSFHVMTTNHALITLSKSDNRHAETLYPFIRHDPRLLNLDHTPITRRKSDDEHVETLFSIIKHDSGLKSVEAAPPIQQMFTDFDSGLKMMIHVPLNRHIFPIRIPVPLSYDYMTTTPVIRYNNIALNRITALDNRMIMDRVPVNYTTITISDLLYKSTSM